MAMAIDFKRIAEDFKATNWRDPGTWSVIPKAVVLVAIIVALPVLGYFGLWQGQLQELEAGKAAEEKFKLDYVNKKKQAVNLDLHKQQLREIDTQFGALLKQLPNKSQMDALLVDINQAGLGRGLQFELFKPAAQETVRDFYAELPITVKVVGVYHDMGAFASDISKLSRIVLLNDVQLAQNKDGAITMDAVAKTYRYLDDEELARQKKAAKDAKAAKK